MKCPKCKADVSEDSHFCSKCGMPLKESADLSVSQTKTIQKPAISSGKTIAGKYKIIEEVGRGGMGVVYKAEDTRLDRTVALKFLSSELIRDDESKKRFVQEAKAAAALNHPNISTIYEIDEHQGQTFIAMEYIQGHSLKKKLEDGPLEIDEAKDIALQVAEGLKEAHEKGIVHRDIKPANIMLTEKGQAKITDFGLAKLSGGVDLTKASTIMGTVAYMSPEQAKGEEVNHRTDIWSLGAVLYEMLSGERPFKKSHEQAVIHGILNEEPVPITEYRSDVPWFLERVIQRSLKKSAKNRYQDIREIITELKSSPSVTLPKFKNSIAVLPFTNMSTDPEQEYFCDGMSEEIINALSHIKELKVVARTSAFSFKGKNVDVRKIGRDLEVETVLEGSVRKVGSRLRITAQLINIADGYHLWSERYDRELDDVFAIQDEISLAVVEKLKVKLLRKEKAAIIKRHTEDKEAYSLYLRGRSLVNMLTEKGISKGIEYLNKAAQKDPDFALPAATLALSYTYRSHYGDLAPHVAYPKALELTKFALEIDNSLALAYAISGFIKAFYDWAWDMAGQDFRKALELNQNSADIYWLYSLYLTVTRRHEEAIITVKRAQELDPLSSSINSHVGQILYWAGRSEEAVDVLRETLSLNPDYFHAHWILGQIYSEKGMDNEALAEFESAAEHSGGNPMAVMSLATRYYTIGRKPQAEKLEKSVVERAKSKYVPPLCFFYFKLRHGDLDKAAMWLDTACTERDSLLPWVLESPSKVSRIPDHPLFNAVLKKWGLIT
jgi:serine/threonine protein kinase/tetratricopeptide (TPR) repeat protein